MGHIVGDGGFFCQNLDIAALPAHPRPGPGPGGRVAALVDHLATAPKGAYVRRGLTAPFHSLHPDGSVRGPSASGRFFHDEESTRDWMVGAVRDVTERRERACGQF